MLRRNARSKNCQRFWFFMTDSALPAMGVMFDEVCALVTAAFALTLLPGFRQSQRSLLSRPDQGTVLVFFLILGLVEEMTISHAGWFNERIVAVCAAGLVAGPWVGLAVSLFVTWLAVEHYGLPLGSFAISMLCGGLAGGWLYCWRPKLAQHPITGFSLTLAVTLLRNGLISLCAPDSPSALSRLPEIETVPLLQGLGTALILAIVEQVLDRDEQTRAAASAEVRALQARMNPHFLFNALNTLAALSRVAPREIPRAVGRLRHFLRASFDQHERALAPLEEELTIVRMYLDIEMLRFGSRLNVEQAIDPGLSKVLVPPFSFQPLVENAVEHGLRSSSRPGRLGLVVRPAGRWLEMKVSDNGAGVPSTKVDQIFFAKRQRVHALTLLRRRLQGLFGRSFQLEVRSEMGEGTTVTMRIPLRKQFEVGFESPVVITPDLRKLASH
jgi:two-component system LytT family sensor kinase